MRGREEKRGEDNRGKEKEEEHDDEEKESDRLRRFRWGSFEYNFSTRMRNRFYARNPLCLPPLLACSSGSVRGHLYANRTHPDQRQPRAYTIGGSNGNEEMIRI